MSRFSGKCDLYDHVSMEKLYDKGSYETSDELECFEIFKAKTRGEIYQFYKCPVTKFNIDFVSQQEKNFEILEDKTFKYMGKIYKSLKSLNKDGGVILKRTITFDTLLDLIPYYPYIITMCSCDRDKEIVYISSESYVDTQAKDFLKYGSTSCVDHYKKQLQQHYFKVVKDYFLYKLEERTFTEIIKPVKNGSDYLGYTEFPIDYMHPIEFVWGDGESKPHWRGAEFLQDNSYSLSKEDVETYLKEDIEAGKIKIRYVAKCDFPKALD